MTISEIKRALRQYTGLKREAARISEQIEAIEARLYTVRTSNLSEAPARGTGEKTLVESLIDALERLKSEYRAREIGYISELTMTERLINKLADPTDRAIFTCRYIDGLKWEQVCVEVSYSWRGVHKRHRKALYEIMRKVNTGK